MRLVNLCGHPIDILLPTGEHRRLPPSGTIARVACRRERREPVAGIALHAVADGAIEGLPASDRGVLNVASTRVAQAAAARGRRDVLAPDTAPESAIRDCDGRIVAIRGLQTFGPLQAG